jgi:hypothetical protein
LLAAELVALCPRPGGVNAQQDARAVIANFRKARTLRARTPANSGRPHFIPAIACPLSPDFSLNKSTARYVLQKDPTGSRKTLQQAVRGGANRV